MGTTLLGKWMQAKEWVCHTKENGYGVTKSVVQTSLAWLSYKTFCLFYFAF